MKKLELKLEGRRNSRIWVGSELISDTQAKPWSQDRVLRTPGHAVLIVDSSLKPQARALGRTLRAKGWRITRIDLEGGELTKTLAALDSVYGKMIEAGADRSSVVFALGGGVIGDVAGFVAATYMRGIRWIGVPTTLLAQVDSSVGGKTGVNHALAKNVVGAFHQPESVICDVSILRTLPPREIDSGLGEIAKYALLADRHFFNWTRTNWSKISDLQEPALVQTVSKCLAIKASVVEKDELEIKGLRASLNLGHTVGHALEVATCFTKFTHGEAVVHGLRAMLEISRMRGHLPGARFEELRGFLAKLKVPAIPKALQESRIAELTRRDKKAAHGRARFVLLKEIGKTVIDSGVSDEEIECAIRSLR